MRTVFKNSAEVYHTWANIPWEEAKIREGRNGTRNSRFTGLTAFSYNAIVGYRVSDNVFLLATQKYSLTTSGHQQDIRGALSHRQVYSVPFIPDYFRSIPAVISEYQDYLICKRTQFFRFLTEQKSQAKTKACKLLQYKALRQEIITVCSVIASELADPENQELINQCLAALQANTDIIADGTTPEGIKALSSIAQQAIDQAHEELTRKEEQLRIQHRLRYETGLIDFRNNPHATLRNLGVLFNPDDMQLAHLAFGGGDTPSVYTSKGINIPLEDARRLYLAFKYGKLLGQTFQNYTITQVNADSKTIVAGCHTIPFAELEQAWLDIQDHLAKAPKELSPANTL